MNLTSDEAREQLEAAARPSVTTPRDRGLYAGGMVVFGFVLGASAIVLQRLDGMASSLAAAAIWGLALATLYRVEKEATTAPLRAKRWAHIGFGSSFALNLLAVTPWLNTQAKDAPVSWPVLLLAALVISIPCLIAAARIWWVRR
ncbi:hypothetical protein [Demetria terragena]|uniref:hypothetical protein n=1 Tax=Demetria terragena TaxID=63959 RepID=UPI0012EA3B26|nr:hypothetical protein [Demetria terragena]